MRKEAQARSEMERLLRQLDYMEEALSDFSRVVDAENLIDEDKKELVHSVFVDVCE